VGVLALALAMCVLAASSFLSSAGADETTEPSTAATSEVTTATEPTTTLPTEPVEQAVDEQPAAETPDDPGEPVAKPMADPTTGPASSADTSLAATSFTADTALNIELNNATADVGTDCPADGQTYWHFVISPNNNHSAFVTFHLNLGDGIHDFSTWVPNGIQNDNVFLLVPDGYSLTSLVKAGSSADISWDGVGVQPSKFQLSHLCPGTAATGSLSVAKIVSPADHDGYPFTVEVTCLVDGNEIAVAGSPFTFTSAADSPHTFTGITAGAVCTVEETGTGGADQVLITYQGGGDNVTVVQDSTVSVTVTNVFNEEGTGSLQVSKTVFGTPVGDDGYPFTVRVECPDDLNAFEHEFTEADPGPWTISGIPAGTTCTVTEPDNGGAALVDISPGSVAIAENTTKTVAVSNIFPGPAVAGTVEVTKAIGPGAQPAADAVFIVEVVCTDGTSATLTFTPTDLGPKSVPVNIEEGSGTTCTVQETNAGAAVGVSYDPPSASDPGFLLTVDAPTRPVTITNSFVAVDPAVASSASTGGTSVLPFTGGTVEMLLKTAAWLLAIGGAALLLARFWQRRRLLG
jgi:hypothetical protein